MYICSMTESLSTKSLISNWVDTYSQSLYSWAYYKTSDKESSEDLVQDTFVAAFQSFESFEGKSNPKTWLFSILNHKISDFHRKNFRNVISSESKLSGDSAFTVLDIMFDENEDWRAPSRPKEWDMSDENLADQPEFNAVLKNCFKKLPLNWSSAVQLKYLDEKDGKEICQDLGITPTNFWQILHRAKLQLRACLELNWFKK